jgi:hypothetical protein
MELLQIRTSDLNITQISIWEEEVRFLGQRQFILHNV